MSRATHVTSTSAPAAWRTGYVSAAAIPTLTLLLTIGSLPLPTLNSCG